MTSPQDLIGASPRRKEDRRLLTGAGRYVDDLTRPGMLYMIVVRSRHAHAQERVGERRVTHALDFDHGVDRVRVGHPTVALADVVGE